MTSGRQAKRAARARVRGTGMYAQVPPEALQDGVFWEDRKPGEHYWAVHATFRLTADDCLDAYRSGQPVMLDQARLVNVAGPGCVACERPWLEVHNKPCPGDVSR